MPKKLVPVGIPVPHTPRSKSLTTAPAPRDVAVRAKQVEAAVRAAMRAEELLASGWSVAAVLELSDMTSALLSKLLVDPASVADHISIDIARSLAAAPVWADRARLRYPVTCLRRHLGATSWLELDRMVGKKKSWSIVSHRRGGLSERKADEVATYLGVHPCCIWTALWREGVKSLDTLVPETQNPRLEEAGILVAQLGD